MSGYDNPASGYSVGKIVAKAVVYSLLVASVVLLNLATLTVFALRKNLRLYSDYFIMNLAVADLGVGVLSIPLYIQHFVSSGWVAGWGGCIFWLLWNNIFIVGSVFCVCLISLDRYLQVSHPIWYRSHQSKRGLLAMVLSPWVAMVLLVTPLLLWKPVAGEQIILDDGTCHSFPYSLVPVIVCFAAAFLAPFLFVCLFNFLVYLNVRGRQRKKKMIWSVTAFATAGTKSSTMRTGSSQTHHAIEKTPTVMASLPEDSDFREQDEDLEAKTRDAQRTRDETFADKDPARPKAANERAQELESALEARGETARLHSDKAAAHFLFVLVFVYAACWMPFAAVKLVSASCPACVGQEVAQLALWLVRSNSAANPVLYALLNSRFREGYRSVFWSWKCRELR